MVLADDNTSIKVRRSQENVRKRPNGQYRHENFAVDHDTKKNICNDTDIEWMSLNYRKERAAKMSKSIRRMVLVMFQEDYQYFPTLREIRDELIEA